MHQTDPSKKKPSTRDYIPLERKLLVGRSEAAQMLSISERALDYLLAKRHITARRIGSRVLIPTADLKRYSEGDHPERVAG